VATASLTVTPEEFLLSFTPSPLAGSERLFCYVTRQCSSGAPAERTFWLLFCSAPGASSPFDLYSNYCTRFRVPYPGQVLKLRYVSVVNGVFGARQYVTVTVGG
jgi:hypothetical protein